MSAVPSMADPVRLKVQGINHWVVTGANIEIQRFPTSGHPVYSMRDRASGALLGDFPSLKAVRGALRYWTGRVERARTGP